MEARVTPSDGWVVATGFVRATGEVLHTLIDPLTVEFVHAFPHRVEIWTAKDHRIVAGGCIDDTGSFVAVEQEEDPLDGLPVVIVVDLLGVDADALA